MDEDTKRRFDAVMELHNGCWKRISERRTYEWRAAFTLWTAFGAFIAIVLANSGSFDGSHKCAFLSGVIIIGGILCWIHKRWLSGLGKMHALDSEMANHYGVILRELSNSKFDEKLQNKIDEYRKKAESFWREWSRPNQWAVTVVLCITAILAVLLVAS